MTSDTDSPGGTLYDEEIFSAPDLVDGRRIVLHAERLHVEKVRVEDNVVVISKRVVTVRQTFEVDVRHEELVVERRPGNGSVMAVAQPAERRVLLYAEQVEVRKTVVPVEEARLTLREVVEVQVVSDSVRREELAT
ncbi:MAG: YsnF/AvaK domain-containing protein [Candidatus Eremiobacteraeota bacterium]|nr:YsnF/AvaK domain-containing protein [Candidatus Eremiobacteraeota bacterium]